MLVTDLSAELNRGLVFVRKQRRGRTSKKESRLARLLTFIMYHAACQLSLNEFIRRRQSRSPSSNALINS